MTPCITRAVAGEGADVDVLARLGRGDELQAVRLARLQQPRGVQHLGVLGHEMTREGVRVARHLLGGQAHLGRRARLTDEQVVRHDVRCSRR